MNSIDESILEVWAMGENSGKMGGYALDLLNDLRATRRALHDRGEEKEILARNLKEANTLLSVQTGRLAAAEEVVAETKAKLASAQNSLAVRDAELSQERVNKRLAEIRADKLEAAESAAKSWKSVAEGAGKESAARWLQIDALKARVKELENGDCFVCESERKLGEKRFTRSHPIQCVDNWFRKQKEWDELTVKLGQEIARLKAGKETAEARAKELEAELKAEQTQVVDNYSRALNEAWDAIGTIMKEQEWTVARNASTLAATILGMHEKFKVVAASLHRQLAETRGQAYLPSLFGGSWIHKSKLEDAERRLHSEIGLRKAAEQRVKELSVCAERLANAKKRALEAENKHGWAQAETRKVQAEFTAAQERWSSENIRVLEELRVAKEKLRGWRDNHPDICVSLAAHREAVAAKDKEIARLDNLLALPAACHGPKCAHLADADAKQKATEALLKDALDRAQYLKDQQGMTTEPNLRVVYIPPSDPQRRRHTSWLRWASAGPMPGDFGSIISLGPIVKDAHADGPKVEPVFMDASSVVKLFRELDLLRRIAGAVATREKQSCKCGICGLLDEWIRDFSAHEEFVSLKVRP